MFILKKTNTFIYAHFCNTLVLKGEIWAYSYLTGQARFALYIRFTFQLLGSLAYVHKVGIWVTKVYWEPWCRISFIRVGASPGRSPVGTATADTDAVSSWSPLSESSSPASNSKLSMSLFRTALSLFCTALITLSGSVSDNDTGNSALNSYSSDSW